MSDTEEWEEKKNWQKHYDTGTVDGPGAGDDLLAVEFDHFAKISDFEFTCASTNDIRIVSRDHDGADVTDIKRFNNVTEVMMHRPFDEEWVSIGAEREIAVIAVNGVAEVHSVNLKSYERKEE